MNSVFDASTRMTDVFSYGAKFHDETVAAPYKHLLLKVEPRTNRAIFPPLLQVACDMQRQFTALNYMQSCTSKLLGDPVNTHLC